MQYPQKMDNVWKGRPELVDKLLGASEVVINLRNNKEEVSWKTRKYEGCPRFGSGRYQSRWIHILGFVWGEMG